MGSKEDTTRNVKLSHMTLLSSNSHCNERGICVESLCNFPQSNVFNRSDSLVLNDTPDFQRQRHRGIYFIPCDATRSCQVIAIPAVPDVFAFEYGLQDLQIQCCVVAESSRKTEVWVVTGYSTP